MTLRKVEGLPGAPWDRPLVGMLDRITVHSEVLEGNPLGDPARRPLYVYRSPGQHGPYDIVSYGSDGQEGGTG